MAKCQTKSRSISRTLALRSAKRCAHADVIFFEAALSNCKPCCWDIIAPMTTPPGSDGEDMAPPGDNDTVPHITPERWRHVKTIFERAIELDPGEERRRFLAAACGNDSGVMREVLSLLEAYAESGDFLEQPLAESFSPILTPEISVLECPKCGLC